MDENMYFLYVTSNFQSLHFSGKLNFSRRKSILLITILLLMLIPSSMSSDVVTLFLMKYLSQEGGTAPIYYHTIWHFSPQS
jgi:hypothetical protein